MSDYPRDLSGLSGPELVRLLLDATNPPPTTDIERVEFFDFKARVFATIADRDENPAAATFAARARSDRDRLLAQIEKQKRGGQR
ncbi:MULTISPECIES: hypothetical protein [Nocardiopsis]|uniref:Uncharacterized protein n=1 Tax=Nocardiopsis dassonvillei (strain ATCC 23218 / DSM 43111 / CIP 107115 / JCM 7437 / KCTC 9190 / NBRC 14626 / NCTC 10488 / NRRL B-5397 / IMRU 509) TaxID=446468 RepID=D7B910_NOCDD|nr:MULTISPECIES: hypothetical protein [Nocardiopsis]ADH70668.1 hypothetical protein Ndas_5288 [Nocardiopsis dassonvillei subsp. dassonvillei DSM 43111]NKY77919.1 hypothetical protein [Nocardiopsis dassonvillei]VEI90877.1 Uncharacterised protein [Nocardiopsis dassonvillei]